jgi:hypothetical protein
MGVDGDVRTLYPLPENDDVPQTFFQNKHINDELFLKNSSLLPTAFPSFHNVVHTFRDEDIIQSIVNRHWRSFIAEFYDKYCHCIPIFQNASGTSQESYCHNNHALAGNFQR